MKKTIVRALISFGLLAGSGALLVFSGCGAGARYTRCTNAGDCPAPAGQAAYCLQSRCVECVGSSSCGEGNLCIDGKCGRRCNDAADCPAGHSCDDGTCLER